MQFSESWLRSLCNPSLSSEELCHVLTMAGLEVEEVKPVAPIFEKVIVAQVLSIEKHPDADKLKVCRVDIGNGEPLQIVCGAPNVEPNLKTPCALIGAALPGMQIKQAKVRGVESFGMLCSARELGLAEDQAGLLVLSESAPVGTDIRDHLDLDDSLITLKLTPNRADCLSLTGVARELSALTGATITPPEFKSIPAVHQDKRTIVLDAAEACPRYCGRVIRGVNAKAVTPEWIKRRIERSGIRPISSLVDITNYVLLELGQPLHAFDNTKLNGAIHVRFPVPGETLKLLNEQAVSLTSDTLVIADDKNVLAIAGIMGGADSGITDATSNVFLESAFFAPAAIAGKARLLGFSSEASHRFERGVDFELSSRAIERTTELILETCGGQAGPITEAIAANHLPIRKPVSLRTSRVNKVLGIALTAQQIRTALNGLMVKFEDQEQCLLVTPPSFRFDIEIEEDLIEEVARIYGYDRIPSASPIARISMMPAREKSRTAMQLRRLIAARDYQEVVTYSFVDKEWEADFSKNQTSHGALIQLANPIASQMSVMRSTLIGGLISTLVVNRKRSTERVRVFEVGRCFLKTDRRADVGQFAQPLLISGLASGSVACEQWGASSRLVDFYDVKADIEALFSPLCPVFSKSDHPAFHPGRSASISVDGKPVGIIGDLHPRWTQKYELGKSPILFEIDISALLPTATPIYREISKFQAVVRDLALVVAQSQSMAPMLEALRKVAPAIVRDISLFDVYQGKGLADSEKSLAFRIVMQDTQRTLEDAEIEDAITCLLVTATRDFNASLRV